jgi:hypothetical protein
MIDEQNIRLNINIVERYSHILFNIDYFNALKAYLQLKSKENLNNLNVIYKELAKNQTVVNKLHYALKEMEYKFTIASRDNYINACKNFNLDTNLEQIKQQNIYIAAKSELLRNSTEENRNILYNTKEYVSLVYNENDVKRVMSEAARIKMEANLSLQSIDEYKQVMKSLKMAYSSIISTPNIVILNMMPHEEEREMTLPYYEAKTELASTIMTLEKDINKLNISKFIIAFNNVFKLIDNNSKEKWITYYNNVLFSKIQNLRVAFYSGEYTNTYDIIKLIIDKLRDFNFENAEERKLRWKEWRKNNLEYDKNRNAEYGKRKPEIIRAKQARRRATCKAQLPSWACIQKIKNVYKYAKQLEIKTGVKMHVDHIYPLKSNYMCGLHVENNLQIILASENCSKGNRIWPGQLDCQKGPVSAIFPKELLALLND